jgi:hypothetical protein
MRRALSFLLLCSFVRPALPQASVPGSTSEATARHLIHTAEAASGAFDAPMRAAVEFAAACAAPPIDRKASRELLDSAYSISRNLTESDAAGISMLQGEIIRRLAQQAPEAIERSLPQDSLSRNLALRTLIEGALRSRKFQRAIGLFLQMDGEPDIDVAATSLLSSLPENSRDDRSRVFTWELTNFGKTVHSNITAGYPADLGSVVVGFWRQLPAPLVHQAIEELLRQSRPENVPEGAQAASAIPSARVGSKSRPFRSYYEFRIQQLVPVLREIDSAEADQLLKDAGVTDLAAAKPSANEAGTGEVSPSLTGITGKTPDELASFEQGARADSAIQEAQKLAANDPESAIESAAAMPDGLAREETLFSLAAALSGRPSLAKLALERLLAREDGHVAPARQVRIFGEAARIATEIKQITLAGKLLTEAFVAADALYKQDANPDDPNLALKLYWPSSLAWRDLIELEFKISPDEAFAKIKDLRDPEVQALEEVFLAGILLKVDLWRETSPMTAHKQRGPN